MSAIILGDPHLGKNLSLGKVGTGSALNSRVVDQVNILNWTLDQALEHYIDHIILTGDVFEEPKPHPSIITLLLDWLKRCEANNVNVHIIIGNHDIFRTGNFYTSTLDIISCCELSNVSVYKDITTVFIDGVAFTFVPFRDRKSFGVSSNAEALALLNDQLIYEALSIPMTCKKVLVGHLTLEGSIPVGDEIDDLANELMCPLSMFNLYDYVWMGHVHKPQVLSKKPHIAHIGSADISNFGETDQKKHIVIFDPEEYHDFKHQVIPTRPLKKLVISVPKDTKDTTQFVIDEINKQADEINTSITRLEIHLTNAELIPVNRSDIEKALYQHGVHNISSISESKKLIPIKKDGSENMDMSIDVASAIKMYATSVIETEQRDRFTTLAMNIYEQFKQEAR